MVKNNIHWIVCEPFKELVIKGLELTKKRLGTRNLVVSKKQLRHDGLKELWDFVDEVIDEWGLTPSGI